jgi:hypothetical protein
MTFIYPGVSSALGLWPWIHTSALQVFAYEGRGETGHAHRSAPAPRRTACRPFPVRHGGCRVPAVARPTAGG